MLAKTDMVFDVASRLCVLYDPHQSLCVLDHPQQTKGTISSSEVPGSHLKLITP